MSVVSLLIAMNSSEDDIKSKKSRKKRYIFIVIVLLIIGGIVFIYKTLNSPAVGTITPNPSISKIAKQVNSPGSYNGKYLSFKYPPNYIQAPQDISGNILEVVSLLSNDHYREHVAVSVVKEPLANDAGLSYRQQHPEKYSIVTNTPTTVVYRSSLNGSEQTGYIAHNGLVASVSLTVGGQKDLTDEYNLIANSLTWKQ